jgi:gliding motility-associated-like protein
LRKFQHHILFFFIALVLLPHTIMAQGGKPADIIADKTTGCAPEVITFQVTNPPATPKGYLWIINGDSISGKYTQNYLFDSKGQYDVTVIITTSNGQQQSITKQNLVTIGKANTNILLNVSRGVLCNGVDTVSLKASVAGVKRWDWIVDGTNYLNAGNTVVHRFLSTGAKDIVIRTLDSSGCYALKTFAAAVLVSTPPVLDFNGDTTKGCVPLYVNLTTAIKTGSSVISTYQWTMSGSNISTSISKGPLSIHYDSTGNYNMQLSIQTNDGCAYSQLKTNYIAAGKVARPVIDSTTKSGCTGTVFSFLNKSQKDPKATFAWSFHGGDPQSGSNDSVQYVSYVKGGNYDVTVSSQNNGCVRTAAYPALVHINGISAAFTADNVCNCKIPDTVNFTPSGSLADSQKRNYLWTFYDADGTTILGTSASANPTFIYNNFGSYTVKLKVSVVGGCTDSVINQGMLVFKPLDPATISLKPSVGCVGAGVSMVPVLPAKCPGVKYLYEWTFFEKNTRSILKVMTGENPKMTYTDTGLYDVSLKITTSGGCEVKKLFSHSIWIVHPKPAFSADTLYGCIDGGITLQQQTTPASTQYAYTWVLTNLADSTIIVTGTGAIYKPVFQVPGIYSVKFATIVGNACKYESPTVKYLNISGISTDFTSGAHSGCIPFSTTISSNILQNIHYGNTSDIVKVQWSANPALGIIFTDANAGNTSITITKAGCYDITLQATNSSGCTNAITKKNFICSGVTANFTMPARVCLGDTVKTISASFNAVKYEWTSKPAATIIPADSGTSAAILFPAPGTYNVRLIAFSALGCADTLIKSINVEHVIADFYSADTANACAPAYVSFKVKRHGADSFFWSFGDGETLVTGDTSIAHIYKVNSGDKHSGFDVTLIAKSNSGCSDMLVRKKYIRVLGPVPAFTMQNTRGCEDLTVTFINKSANAPHTYLDYGDFSNIDSLKFGPHTYTVKDSKAEYAVFKPRLLAKDEFGCTAWAPIGDSIVVYRRPRAAFTYSATTGCWPYPVQFTDSSAFAGTYAWDFDNDGITDDISRNPKVVLKPGVYHVKLTVQNRFGCSDAEIMTQAITVYPNVTANISTPEDTICSGSSVSFHCAASRPDLVKKYSWTVDGVLLDSTVFHGPDISYRFLAIGFHPVSVTLTTLAGCEVTVSMIPAILVPDTLQKAGTDIHYVTVNRDSSLGISWHRSASPFFGKYELYRIGPNGANLIYTSHKAADTLYTDRNNVNVNRYHYTYYIKETDRCGKVATISAPHTSILLTLSAISQNKLQLTWTAYKGWQSVSAYRVYRNDKAGFVLLTTLSGTDTSYADADICNSTYAYRIVGVDNTMIWISESNSAKGKPDYVYRKEGENMVYATVTDDDKVNMVWTATAPRTTEYIIDRYTAATGWHDDFARSKSNMWKDDKVSVNTSSYTYRIHILDKCGDITGAGTIGKSILLKAGLYNDAVLLNWTKYAYWNTGVDHYNIEIQQNNDSWSYIAQVPANDTIYTDRDIHKDIHGKYVYRVIAVQKGDTSISSTSNKASVILPSRVFIPNAFTPGGDGVNEIFKPVCLFIAENGLGVDYNFAIYNRWGEKLYQTNNPAEGWDGTFKGQTVMEGVYIYTFDAVGYDRQQYHLKGSVTLMR